MRYRPIIIVNPKLHNSLMGTIELSFSGYLDEEDFINALFLLIKHSAVLDSADELRKNGELP